MSDLSVRLQAALGDAYRVEKELGGGGMSRLFLAHEASLNREVVVKVLPPEFTSEVSAVRFQQEIELAAHLQHPNILPVLTAGAKEDLLYYVMPYVPGESLRHRLTREGKLPVADAVRILSEVADALAYAHAEGVIHRDIKPENILLEGGHAVLTDFGVARALVEARSGGRLTETGLALSTPGYMSPEQAAGERHVDARADVYALAVVGYEMLTGQPPFAGPTAQAVIAQHLTATPRPLTDVRPETPPEVGAAIARALAKDPGARIRTAAEFRDALGAPPAGPAPRRWAKLGWAVGGAAVVAAVAGGVVLLRSTAPRGLDPNLVAVAPFDVLDPPLQLWREGLVDVLSANLDGAGPLRTVSPTLVVRRWNGRADPASAAELGRRTGARLAVYGRLVETGTDSVRLTAALLDVPAGRIIGEVELRDLASGMDRLADSLTVALLRELGRTRPIGAVRLASLGSTSLPALKAFLQGEQFFRRTVWDSAIAYYQRAIALDSTFGLAMRRIGNARGWQFGGGDSLARVYALRAGRLNRGLTPRESLLVVADSVGAAVWGFGADTAWWLHVRRLLATLGEVTRRYPDDPEAWYELGDARYHFGFGPGIAMTDQQVLETFDRAIALDSAFGEAYIHPVEVTLKVGGPPMAHRYARAYLALNPKDVDADAIRLADELLGPEPVDWKAVNRALDTLSRGAVRFARSTLRSWPDSAETAVRLARQLVSRFGSSADSLDTKAFLVGSLVRRGHLREAYASVGAHPELILSQLSMVGGVPADTATAVFHRWLRDPTRMFDASGGLYWWARRGDTASLAEFARRSDSLARFASKVSSKAFFRYMAEAGRAYLPLARHDTAEALRRFTGLPDSLCPACYPSRFARPALLAERGQDREAATLLDQRLPFNLQPLEVLWALERGQVNERLGNRDKAIASYRYVADAWMHADPELQPYVEETKAALKRLTGEPRR